MQGCPLGRCNERIRPFISVAFIIYIVGIQFPQLSPYRFVTSDEFLISDSAYEMASGHTKVPALQAWSHIIPEFGTINFHYPPLYFYLMAFIFHTTGFSVTSVGLLHAVIRLISSAMFYGIARKNGYSKTSGLALASVWATFCHGPTGRPEDLGILFILCGALIFLSYGHTRGGLVLSGMCQGAAVLAHPTAVVAIIPVNAILSWLTSSCSPITAIKKLCAIAAVMTITAVLVWLPWIISYWHEFKVLFLGFVLPDSGSTSYWNGLSRFLVEAATGGWAWRHPFFPENIPQFRYHYSVVPLLLLLFCCVILSYHRRSLLKNSGIIFLILAAIPLFVSRNTYYAYIMSWFNTCLLVSIAVIKRPPISTKVKPAILQIVVVIYLALLPVLLFQTAAHAFNQIKQTMGTFIVARSCAQIAHASSLSKINPGEKVITNSGYTFYHIRDNHPIFWPSGLEGRTPSGYRFKSDYDGSFRWMVLKMPLGETANPGNKFGWDATSIKWFEDNFELFEKSSLPPCYSGKWRETIRIPENLYIYKRKTPVLFDVANAGWVSSFDDNPFETLTGWTQAPSK